VPGAGENPPQAGSSTGNARGSGGQVASSLTCAKCQTENRPGRRFCSECGAALAVACPSCGFANESGEKFCGGCGASLAVATPQPGSPTPAFPVAPEPTPSVSRFGSPEAYTPQHLAKKILASKSALEGERKQVTVLFADLKGSMELLADRDPEEARAILDPVLELMMEAVHEYEGTVNQVMGDGIMALFGAPVALEDHAVRACLAGLRMQEAVRRHADALSRGSDSAAVRIRVGLNSGEVVVRAIGSDLHMDYTAVGQTTHLAARMEQTARSGSILMTAETSRLAAGYIQARSLGPMTVKGLAEPVEVHEVVGLGGTRTRLQVSALRGFTRLVGRESEMELLPTALASAAAGQGQVVAFVGEAGLGKSRMFWEFTHSHHARDWLILEARSVSYGKATTYLPVMELLKAYFQIDDRDEPSSVQAKVTSKLRTLDLALETVIVPMLAILHLPIDDQHWAALDPSQRRHRMLEAVKRLLIRQSEVHPLLLVFEDLHWIDSETQALLDGLVQILERVRVLLLVNYRPEYRHGWNPKPYYTEMRIEPLPPQSAEELLATLLGDDPTLTPLKQLLIERTAGNPFFLEESVRSLVETETLAGERGAHRLAKPLTSVQVPATVQSLLAARIDRLSLELKGLLQSAAVIGKDVPLALLRSVADLADEELRRGLDDLQAAELLYETSPVPEAEYTFKHALTYEVAYASLLQARRRTLHSRIIEAIEQRYANRLTEHVERLAHHAYRGQVWDKAVTYLRQAGAKAQGRSAHREALTFLDEALEALRHLPETPERQEQEIDVRLELRGSLYPLGEFEKMLTYLREAEAMATKLADARRLGLVSVHIGEYFRQTGQFAEARRLAEQALVLGDKLQDVPLQLYARHYLGLACHALGDYRRASELLRAVVQSPQGVRGTVVGSWEAYKAINLAWLARCLAEIGEFEEGVAAGRQAVAIAEGIDSPYSLAAACIGLGYICLVRGDLEAAGPVLERACSVARDANIALFRPQATRLLGGAYLLAGRLDEGVMLVKAAADEVEARRLLMQHAAVLALLGEACLSADRVDEASAATQRALALARERGQRGDEAVALRVLGDASARSSIDIEKAEHHYLAAIALAGDLEMRPLLARGHLGIGRLYLRAGDRVRAEDHLLLGTRLFIAMDMRVWLQQAVTSLSELGRELIVARDQRDLFEYLNRALAPDGPLRVVLDDEPKPVGGRSGRDGRSGQHVKGKLQLHGLSITEE